MIDFVPDYLLGNYRNLIATFRIYNTRSMILFYFLGLALYGNLRLTKDTLLMPVIFILIYASASIFNYGLDRKIDKANKRTNPFLFTKSLRYAYLGGVLLAVGSLFFSVLTLKPQNTFITSLLLISLGVAYSHPRIKLSHHPVGKFLVMMATYTLVPGIFGVTYFAFNWQVIFQIIVISLLYGSIMIYSDVKDVTGDLLFGKRTLAACMGLKKLTVLGVSMAFTASLLALMVLPAGPVTKLVFLGGFWILLGVQIIAYIKNVLIKNAYYRYLVGYGLIAYLVLLIAVLKFS